MSNRDYAFTILFFGSLAIAILIYLYARWKRGQSPSMSIFFAGNAFGGTLCAFTFLSYDTFLEPPLGMGVERIVYPFMFLLVSFIISLISSLILFIFFSSKKPSNRFNLTDEAKKILRDTSKKDI